MDNIYDSDLAIILTILDFIAPSKFDVDTVETKYKNALAASGNKRTALIMTILTLRGYVNSPEEVERKYLRFSALIEQSRKDQRR